MNKLIVLNEAEQLDESRMTRLTGGAGSSESAPCLGVNLCGINTGLCDPNVPCASLTCSSKEAPCSTNDVCSSRSLCGGSREFVPACGSKLIYCDTDLCRTNGGGIGIQSSLALP